MDSFTPLKAIETEVMEILERKGEILISRVPDKSETDALGTRTPGHPTYRRLIKLDLVYQTEEGPLFEDEPDGPTWTPSYGLTEKGEAWLKAYRAQQKAEAETTAAQPRARTRRGVGA